jgi:hypothetical protein
MYILRHAYANKRKNNAMTGTKIVLYNLKTSHTSGRFELDFECNPKDILNSENQEFDCDYGARVQQSWLFYPIGSIKC